MRTTLNIDDNIMEKVMSYTGQKNRSEAVRQALSSFIKEQKKKQILELRGQVNIEDDWRELRKLDTSPL
jgi:metal-responsive CopG/Arc/MetJ family transcriptional regulator